MTRKDLETAEGVIAWADPYNQSSLMGHPEWWEDAEFLAACVRLRAAFDGVLAQARIDAKAAREEGYNRSNREFVFPFDDFDVTEEIVNTLRAALEKK